VHSEGWLPACCLQAEQDERTLAAAEVSRAEAEALLLLSASQQQPAAADEHTDTDTEAEALVISEARASGRNAVITSNRAGLTHICWVEGEGECPAPDDAVEVHYQLRLLDGRSGALMEKVLDSSGACEHSSVCAQRPCALHCHHPLPGA
jgi:FKBP-type peptidyl-prolyl cis-trans isomerase